MTTFLTIQIQGIVNPVLPSVGSGAGETALSNILGAVVGIILIVGFIFAIFHFIFGAITWITASGDKTKLQSAQERITQAVVGLIIMFCVWAIMTLLGQFLGIGFPKIIFPTVENPSGSTVNGQARPSSAGGGGGGGPNTTN